MCSLRLKDDVAQCKTVHEEKCVEVKEGYSTVLKCDKVSRSRRMMMVTPLQWPREVCSLEKQQVKKYTPDTSCQKVPKEMCAPKGCGIVEVGQPWSSGAPVLTQGPVQCRDKLKTVVVDNPVEECDMEPIRTCR